MVDRPGFEPRFPACEAGVLPLNYQPRYQEQVLKSERVPFCSLVLRTSLRWWDPSERDNEPLSALGKRFTSDLLDLALFP